jgi:hypothetical protein
MTGFMPPPVTNVVHYMPATSAAAQAVSTAFAPPAEPSTQPDERKHAPYQASECSSCGRKHGPVCWAQRPDQMQRALGRHHWPTDDRDVVKRIYSDACVRLGLSPNFVSRQEIRDYMRELRQSRFNREKQDTAAAAIEFTPEVTELAFATRCADQQDMVHPQPVGIDALVAPAVSNTLLVTNDALSTCGSPAAADAAECLDSLAGVSFESLSSVQLTTFIKAAQVVLTQKSDVYEGDVLQDGTLGDMHSEIQLADVEEQVLLPQPTVGDGGSSATVVSGEGDKPTNDVMVAVLPACLSEMVHHDEDTHTATAVPAVAGVDVACGDMMGAEQVATVTTKVHTRLHRLQRFLPGLLLVMHCKLVLSYLSPVMRCLQN